MNDIKIEIDKYFSRIKTTLDLIKREEINEVVKVLEDAYRNQKKIFICGNGGSAATSSHMANDLIKGAAPEGRVGLRGIALTDPVPVITAWSNDESYGECFLRQLRVLFDDGDIVIGFSGSGNSENVIRAIEYANEREGVTIGFTGRDGGKLKQVAQKGVHAPVDGMEQIEDIHMILEHLIVVLLRKILN